MPWEPHMNYSNERETYINGILYRGEGITLTNYGQDLEHSLNYAIYS